MNSFPSSTPAIFFQLLGGRRKRSLADRKTGPRLFPPPKHAHQGPQSRSTPALESFHRGPRRARLKPSARAFIPSDATGPGAREAGVVYFIDPARLKTFFSDALPVYRKGLEGPRRRPPPNSFPAFPRFFRRHGRTKTEDLHAHRGGSPSGRKSGARRLAPRCLSGFLPDPARAIPFSDFSSTQREVGIATFVGWKSDRPRSIPQPFLHHLVSMTRITPAGSPCPAKRRKK